MTDQQNSVEQLDWLRIAKLAGEHGVRYRTNRGMAAFLAALRLQPARTDVERLRERIADLEHVVAVAATWTAEPATPVAEIRALFEKHLPTLQPASAPVAGEGEVDELVDELVERARRAHDRLVDEHTAFRKALAKIAATPPILSEDGKVFDMSTLPCQQIARQALTTARDEGKGA